MKRALTRLPRLIIASVITGLGLVTSPEAVQAACTPIAMPASDVENDKAAFDTVAHAIDSFNFARRQEGCNVPLNIDTAVYASASEQQQILLLINAERQDRGLKPLKLDATLLSPIAFNHAREVFQYDYFFKNAHSSPINVPNGSPAERINLNPAVNDHKYLCCAENISPNNTLFAPGRDSAAMAVYSLMYHDAVPGWGHRQNILGYNSLVPNNPGPGHYDWIGIGVATGGGQLGTLRVLDFLEEKPSRPYTPPSQADTQPPGMSPPTITGSNTVRVTNVADNSDGSANGVRGVTGVVFYVGSIAYQTENRTFTTVPATDMGNGVWQATLPATVTDLSTLHAVAVDGSGNYTDCAANALSCGEPKVADGGQCTTTYQCANFHGPGVAGSGCDFGRCTPMEKDWAGIYYVPSACVGTPGGKPGSCEPVKVADVADGAQCAVPDQCANWHGPGVAGSGCDGGRCAPMKKDWAGVYFIPSACVGTSGGKPGSC